MATYSGRYIQGVDIRKIVHRFGDEHVYMYQLQGRYGILRLHSYLFNLKTRRNIAVGIAIRLLLENQIIVVQFPEEAIFFLL